MNLEEKLKYILAQGVTFNDLWDWHDIYCHNSMDETILHYFKYNYERRIAQKA